MAYLAMMYDALEDAHREDIMQARRHHANLRHVNNVFDLREDEFLAIYRMKHNHFESLCDDIEPFLKYPDRVGEMQRSTKILTALNFYASGSYQRYVGYGLNMSQPSTSRAVSEVTAALNAPQILAKYIHFPQDLEERNKIKQGFFQKFKIPGVVGCIDGTHVAIIRPHEYEERYFNRKHYHSLNVQVICDSDLNIISVDSSYGGASHDSHIWNNHPIKEHLTELTEGGEISYLLGDSGYAQRTYMMTPILNAVPGSAEEHFDKTQKSARNTVERTFGVLKARWRCLLAARELHYKPAVAARITNACCVLHNMCNQARLQVQRLTRQERIVERRLQEYAEPGEPRVAGGGAAIAREVREGREARARLVRNLWAFRRI